MAWNIRSYTIEKLEHLLLVAMSFAQQPLLAFLLQETHLPASTALMGTLVDYQVL